MPLLKGKKNIGHNIKELEDHDHPRDQAIAIALKQARMKAAALHLDKLYTKHKGRVTAMKQVYVRRKMEHCNASRLDLAEVISQDRDTLRIKVVGSRSIVEISAAEVVPVSQVRPGTITRNPRQPRALPRR